MTDPTPIEGDVYVSPRYLAGLPGHADPSFDPVKHWPHHHLDDSPFQTVVTSPDHRIKIGWAGDDYDVWRISAAEDAVSRATWTATFNQNTPPEIVHGLTSALAREWSTDTDSFLADPSHRWTDAIQPLLDAGWQRRPLTRGTVEIIAPDGLAGASIDVVGTDPDRETVELWAGPEGWGTRAEAIFTARTPKHLIAATAAAFIDPTPVARYRNNLAPRLAQLAQLTPVEPPKPPAPTPLDVQQAATARARHAQHPPLEHHHAPPGRRRCRPARPPPLRTRPMSTDPFSSLSPDQHVKVLPRHLAGTGPIDLGMAWPFPEDWPVHQVDDGAALATSPCLRLVASLAPDADSPHLGKWTVTANRAPFGPAAWQVTFYATTPVELLHDFHHELVDLYLEDRHSDQDRLLEDDTPPQEAYTQLLTRGWSHEIKTDGTQFFRAPDSLSVVRHRYAIVDVDSPTWSASGGYPSEPDWRARFS